MSENSEITKKITFKLPDQIIGSSDLIRTIRELEKIDDFLYQANLRTPGTSVTPPKSSKALEDLSELNQISLLNELHRKKLLEILNNLSKQSPVIHISFAVEASNDIMQKIAAWTRENIHPYTLVNVGLQPSIIVGCEVRSTNKIFDMSLRNKFEKTREILIKKLEESDD